MAFPDTDCFGLNQSGLLEVKYRGRFFTICRVARCFDAADLPSGFAVLLFLQTPVGLDHAELSCGQCPVYAYAVCCLSGGLCVDRDAVGSSVWR